MSEHEDLFPIGLTRSQSVRLLEFRKLAGRHDDNELLQAAEQHLQRTLTAYLKNRLINQRLAAAIHEVITQVVEQWDSIPAHSRSFVAGAILYFADCSDDEPDFNSPIGFEDDAEILNACLRFAKLDDLCLNVEDYDDA